jgi:hypothetical protein
MTEAQKKYTEAQAAYGTAPADIRSKLITEKGYDLNSAKTVLSAAEAELSTARGRFLEGSLSATDYAQIVSRYHNTARNFKKMNEDLTTETNRGIDFYKSQLDISQNQLKNAQDYYNTLLDLETKGVAEATTQKKQAISDLSDAYKDIETNAREARKIALDEAREARLGGGGGSGPVADVKADLEASKGEDGFVNTDKYKELRNKAKDKTSFDKNYSYMLNPNDTTAQPFRVKASNYTAGTIPEDVKGDLLVDIENGQTIEDVMAAYPEVDTNYIKSLYTKPKTKKSTSETLGIEK